MPYIVALTGGIASGKSTVEKLFSELGVPIIDADIIARQVVEKDTPALKAITAHFGTQILEQTGSLNRARLREIIFNHPKEREWLNHLLHPLIQQLTQQQFNQVTAPYLLWVVPLLIENNLQNKADRVLVIDTKPETQLKRLQKRDNVTEQLAKNMLSSQTLNEIRLSYADDVIENNNGPEELRPIVQELHNRYLELSTKLQ